MQPTYIYNNGRKNQFEMISYIRLFNIILKVLNRNKKFVSDTRNNQVQLVTNGSLTNERITASAFNLDLASFEIETEQMIERRI